MEPGRPLACRGIRGAVSISANAAEAVSEGTTALLTRMVEENGVRLEDIAAAIFTVPDDLPGANPAAVAREVGWGGVPLLLVREHGGDTSVPRCLRLLLLWNTELRQADVRHAYLGGAAGLRPDLSQTRMTGSPR